MAYFALQLINTIMAIKQTDIRLMELTAKLIKIKDRVNELKGEKITLFHKMENGAIHPILFALIIQAMDFEVLLLEQATDELDAEHQTILLVAETGLDFSKEEF
jgi:hypothetical protein